ncbi:granzyme B-like [Trichechus manatus latirostris]|uniref:Granzyme B-like n=1 Tax=Trichechus manatus latirostris TaxID=127582 RepID=A0A2Y9R6L1_TRIMA|nr:granzyme B-like [Trichechus manatus latirostris]
MLPLLILLSLPLPSKTFVVITEGIEARPHSRPYMTAIKTSGVNNKWELCGGFLVREDFVLTVAHCLKRMIFVILGAHNATRNETTRQVIHVIQSFPHPMYKSDTLVNDIMLLKGDMDSFLSAVRRTGKARSELTSLHFSDQLKNKVRLNTAVKTISLPRSQDWVWPERVCRVAGWRTENGKFSATLQEVELEVQDKKKCKQFFIHYDDGRETMV